MTVSVNGSLYCFQNPSTVVSLLYTAKVLEAIDHSLEGRAVILVVSHRFCKRCCNKHPLVKMEEVL
jgi:hypothetical protein